MGPDIGSSQSLLFRGVLQVGELNGGVTGALIEPPLTNRWWGNLDVADDEPEVRVLSHGMREFGSALFLLFALAV